MKTDSSNIFLSKTKRVAQALAQKANVPVVLIDGGTRTDGETLFLDMQYGYYEGDLKKFYDGIIDHEVSHILHSNFANDKARNKIIDKKAINYLKDARINNIVQHLEDLRVNKLMSEKFLGSKENIIFSEKSISQYYIDSMVDGKLPNNKINRFLLAVRFSLYPELFIKLFGKDKEILKLFSHYWKKEIKNKFENCNKTEDVIYLAKEIFDYFEENKKEDKKNKDKKGEKQKEKNKKEENNNDESNNSEDGDDDENNNNNDINYEDSETESKDDDNEDGEIYEYEDDDEYQDGENKNKCEEEKDDDVNEDEQNENDTEDNTEDGNEILNIDKAIENIKEEKIDKNYFMKKNFLEENFENMCDEEDMEFNLCNFQSIRKIEQKIKSLILNKKTNNVYIFEKVLKVISLIKTNSNVNIYKANVDGLFNLFKQKFYSRSEVFEYEHESNGDLNLLESVKENTFQNYNSRFKYINKTEAKSNSIAISILLDISGSMSGEILYVNGLISDFSNLIYKLNIPFEVTCHNAGSIFKTVKYGKNTSVFTYIFKEFNYNKLDKLKYIQFMNGGCNCDGYAMQNSMYRLFKRNEERKMLFYICDGKPTGYVTEEAGINHMKYIVDILKKNKIEFYGIGLDVNVIDIFGKDRSFLINKDKNNLTKELSRILINKI